MIVVIAYGFIATAVCVLVGPVFVPFFIVPKMEWLFWGWFRCFIQYAFYQVIASAVVYIIGNLMLGALRLPPSGTLSTAQVIAWFPVLFITFLASIYALLKVPALTNHIFSGTAGTSSAAFRKVLPMSNDASFHDAKRLYLEQYGDPMVTNTYLKIALALLSVVCVALALIDLRTIRTFQNFDRWSSASTTSSVPRPSTTTTLNTSPRMPRRSIFVSVLRPLLPPQPLHDSGRFLEVTLFPRWQAR